MKKPLISLVIPTLNEEGNIALLVQRTHEALTKSKIGYELIFIDDHSTDATREVIEALSDRYPIQLHLKRGQKGKAQSLLEGFQLAKYDIIAIMDGDLQYSPEEIPLMARKLDEGYDLIQSRRVSHNASFLRNLSSKAFNFFFIRVLHQIKLDTQSGLKLFRKSITQEIEINPTPWTFDLEFLIQSRHAGYKIASHDIVFEDRHTGQSKINFFQATWEIASNAVKLKFKSLHPISISADDQTDSMIGAGKAYKGQRFITHSTLPHDISALVTMVPWQKVFVAFLFGLLLVNFVLFPLNTAIIFTAILSFIYFADVLFNFYVVTKSLTAPPELTFTEDELNSLSEAELPIYTILCPLFKEAHILPGFVDAIERLDWPKNKLDVLLLLEETDSETIDAANNMDLPVHFRIAIVPQSAPQTKPKACNYGLNLARGEYLVVYDAEDLPDADQLKKAYVGFNRVDTQVACLQAKLNYHNPHHNFLTRLFTAEYSLWFDVILPGLQSINGYIPLGGTSNHFKTQTLLDLEGWDPFNVTEDCDLGARLFKRGFRTAIIDSTTLEEANSNVWNWMRQRSRWIKGYMQTYLVHMRKPVQFFRESGVHAAIFQLVVGGKIAFMLINPFLWLMTITYFVFRATAGPTIEALYPPAVFYIAVSSLLLGNFLYLYYYMIGCAKREHWSVIKYVYLVPVYWFMTSLAAVIALYQLIVKPHYWEKTNHGLVQKAKTSWLPANLVSESGVFLVAVFFSNFLNFIFNAYLGRALSFEQLGLVTLVNTILSLFAILFSGLGATINYRTAFFSATNNHDLSNSFFSYIFKRSVIISIVASALWIAAIPLLSPFFRISDLAVLLLFTPALTFGVVSAANKGFLQGRLKFSWVASVYIVEALSKLALAFILIKLDLNSFVYLAIPLSIVSSALVSWFLRRKIFSNPPATISNSFPTPFFLSAILATVSSTVFLSLDIILVKHFMDPLVAGEYVLLSLVGKMIFFFGSLPALLMITLVTADEVLGKDTKKILRILLGVTGVLVATGFVFLGPLGRFILPVLLGSKTLVIMPFVNTYAFAISLFTMANVLVSYHLAKRNYIFPAASLVTSVFMTVGIIVFHQDLAQVVKVIYWSGIFGLGLMSAMHLLENKLKLATTGLADWASASQSPTLSASGSRILIFNWRDTKHVFAGGAEIYIQELAKEWVKAGNQVTIFCGNDKKSKSTEIIDGVEIVRRGGFYLVYVWAFIYYFWKFRGKFDVIVDCQNGIPFFTPFYVKEPVFCLMHHVHQEVFTRSLIRPLAAFARFLENGLMPIVYRNTKFITISRSSKAAIEELGLASAGIDIVHPGVNLNISAATPKSRTPTILYLGRLKAYKSVDVLIKAFAIVAEIQPSSRLLIAGSGEEEANLKHLAHELHISDKIRFLGRVSEEEKIELLQKAWVFVNPSFMEGWGITTVEANACGTPIVAADVPGLRDSVQHEEAGYLVRHGDYPAFAEKILHIIENEEVRHNMGRKGVVWASNFDWVAKSMQFLSIIQKENDMDGTS